MNGNQKSQSDLPQFLSECPLFVNLNLGQLEEVAQVLEQINSYPAKTSSQVIFLKKMK